MAHRGRALLGDRDARAHLDRAVRGFARSLHPFEEARTHLVAATVHVAAGRVDAARQAATAASTVFGALEATPWVARAEALLRTLETEPAAGASVLTALSVQERRVAQLVIGGASNRDVADELVLSTKTVEFHLNNVYRKLRITSRVQLIHLAITEGRGGGGEVR